MNKLISIIDKFLEWFMVTLMAVLVVDVTWQVISRYLLGEASSFSEEVARYLLIWIGLLGSAYAYRRKMHLAFDLFTDKATGKVKYWMELVIHSFVIFFSVIVLIFGGWYLVQLTWELNQLSASLQISLAYVYFALPLSGVLIVIYALDFIRQIVNEGPQEIKQQMDEVV
ncbi:TRAP transporter small permease [Rhodohalobacter sp. 614A]|uniref:TRAP transporter small permease n=1 Tax=Rhodohalobacter sp. 614A TaxID=2908649 RepID=UPI001F3E209F|nr:TRAP transporter small permease [Rhodohalobacter sp. 614A]